MKKIIGGLLVLTLLSSPSMTKADIIAYEVYRSQNQIIAYIRKQSDDEGIEIDVGPEDVDGLMSEIDRNNRNINALLKNNHNVFAAVQETMSFKSSSKTRLTEEQMVVYKDFSDYYNKELNELNRTLAGLNGTDTVSRVKHEICRTDTDYGCLYTELKTISEGQYSAISNLNSIISKGQETLAVL